jgi:transposase
MFIDDSTYTRNGKTYRRVLLRNSYRAHGKVRHDTLANLSQCSDEEIEALKLALKHKGRLTELGSFEDPFTAQQGLAVGAVWVLNQLAKQLGITQALGRSRPATLTLWLVLATVIEQGSRLSAVRLAQRHAVCDILKLERFNEDDLYHAMDWLAQHQGDIEQTLFNHRYRDPAHPPVLYLYEVTSSYLEGEYNERGEYGYNRDGKRGKKQIVIGLLTDEQGWPLSVEVFAGNTQDPRTVKHQIDTLAQRFGVKNVTFVGDRGMIKSLQISDLNAADFHYITAITKPQIEALIRAELFQWPLFDENLAEVVDDKIRYVLRRNPQRAEELAASRQSKLQCLQRLVEQRNADLQIHPKAKVETALKKVQSQAEQLKIHTWVQIKVEHRTLLIEINQTEKNNVARLDGCYVIKTDLAAELAGTETVHARYKGLAEVEFAFRTMKTTLLEMRGIFVRKANRTRAHVFAIMIAYLLAYHLRRCWSDIELTVEEGMAELASICAMDLIMPNGVACQIIPEPRPLGRRLLQRLHITLPDAIPQRNVNVVTRKKLVSERKVA